MKKKKRSEKIMNTWKEIIGAILGVLIAVLWISYALIAPTTIFEPYYNQHWHIFDIFKNGIIRAINGVE